MSDADEMPTEPAALRWGLDDVEYGDDGDTVVLLSDTDGRPYTLTLGTDRAAALRETLAGPAAPEQAAPGRRILTDDEYADAFDAALAAVEQYGTGSMSVAAAVDTALAKLGILAPHPDPEPGQCPAMFATPDGTWQQCADEPGHDPADGHDSGDYGWADGIDGTEATPEPLNSHRYRDVDGAALDITALGMINEHGQPAAIVQFETGSFTPVWVPVADLPDIVAALPRIGAAAVQRATEAAARAAEDTDDNQ